MFKKVIHQEGETPGFLYYQKPEDKEVIVTDLWGRKIVTQKFYYIGIERGI